MHLRSSIQGSLFLACFLFCLGLFFDRGGKQNHQGSSCGYQLRSRKTAFTLSFLLGNWGAGMLYLGLIGMGVTKVR